LANVASLNTSRSEHTATLLPSGQVLVAGGDNSGGYLASAEVYGPSANTWTTVSSLNTARDALTATLLPSGKVRQRAMQLARVTISFRF
jgi:trimeric autotransporter adhesin